jgi:hypothetical protein
MERSARIERLNAAWQAPGIGGIPAASNALRRLLALPENLGVAIIVVGLFCLTVLVIAFIYDAPLSYPRERISLALGYSAVLPVLTAVVLYISLRLLHALIFRRADSLARLSQMVATDMTLMGLFVLATYFHFSLKTWAHLINPNRFDATYMAIDRTLRPVIDLFDLIRMEYFTQVPNTDALYQAAFLAMFISGFCTLAVTRNPVYPRFCVGVLLTICLGALSYLVAPALGPFLYEQGLNAKATEAQAGMLWAHQQVMHEGMSWIAEAGPDYFTGGLAAMPSLHLTHALVMTWFMVRARSLLIPLFLLICFWVTIESVASRWHYLIDLPAGALLAVFIIWLTNRLCALSDRTT